MMKTEIQNVPFSAPGELEKWRPMIEGKKFIWLLSPPWNNVWTRQNHFAVRLARLGAEVLYVENPSALSSLVKQRRWTELASGGRPQVEMIEPGLHVMRLPLTLPGAKQSDVIGLINGHLIAGHIRDWVGKRGWSDYTCWCRVPYSLFALQRLAPTATVYDITDDYELYESQTTAREKVRAREKELLSRADQVFITTDELRKKDSIAALQPHVVPNGVEFDLFAQASQPGMVHPVVRGADKPVIGYIGLTSHWMDFELLEILGKRWPGQVVMIGPIAAQVEARARAIPGIIWGGFVPQHELGPYIRGIDVCIMPHLANELRRRSNPLKIREYLAMGKPFVSVDLPALASLRHLIDVAGDREEFIRLVEKNLKDTYGQSTVKARQDAARSYSWDTIFGRVLNHLQPLLRRAA